MTLYERLGSMGTGDEHEALLPVEQAAISFYGRELVAVRLADGRIAAVVRWMCEGMELHVDAQLQRIRRKTALRDELVTVQVQTEGGPQAMAALTLRGLPGWLYTIDETRVAKAEARASVILFQREATDVLASHFARPRVELPAPAAMVPAEPVTKPEHPAAGADALTMATYYRDMAAWYEWQADIEHWRSSVESRLESVEEVTRLVPEILERLGPQTLSAEHQATVQAFVNRLHDLLGRPHAAIYNDVRQAFHVGRYTDLPESRWTEIATWFQERIDRAAPRGGPVRETGEHG
jgi:P22_AR N-terminal domain